MVDRYYGHWSVDAQTFTSKTLANYFASTSGKSVKWIFHNDVWTNFINTKRHTLGVVPLNDLYRQRALQLRDKYDYLILNYSGGADSHNILMTFLNNNIKLDEICTHRSERIDSKLYTPNTNIKTAENLFSEWDYVTKPTLDWVAKYHPEIKISVADPFDKSSEIMYNDNTFEQGVSFTGAFDLRRLATYSPTIDLLAGSNTQVAHIYGIDKPTILIKNNKCYMYFSDTIVAQCNYSALDKAEVELFYYSKDMPELPFEQAYRVYQYYLANKELQYRIDVDKCGRIDEYKIKDLDKVSISVLYTTWDWNKFQAIKPGPFSTAGRSRDTYYVSHSELKEILEPWRYHFNNWYNSLSENVLAYDTNMQGAYINQYYYLGDMSDCTAK
jgi:hypothetical protein